MNRSLIITLLSFVTLLITAPAVSVAPPESIEARVAKAETVFVGKLINRMEVEGDWIHAELEVTQALHQSKVGDKIPVIWRLVKFNGAVIFDCPEGKQGVAVLDAKHKGRYWLRDDKFLSLDLLDQVKKAVDVADKDQKP